MSRKKTVAPESTPVTKKTSTGGKMSRKKTGAATGAGTVAPVVAPKKSGQMGRNNPTATPKKGPNKLSGYVAKGDQNPKSVQSSRKRDVTGKVETKGGTYKVFKKDSTAAKDFRSAFSRAKKQGYKTFTYKGQKYTTETK